MMAMAPRVAKWVDRLLNPKPLSGTFLPNDEVPKTLDPVLRAIFQDQFPVLRETIERVAQWSIENPGEAFPKTIGSHEFNLRGRRGTRRVYPYAQWMLQRALEVYQEVGPSERLKIDGRLRELGGLETCRPSRYNPSSDPTSSLWRPRPDKSSAGPHLSLHSYNKDFSLPTEFTLQCDGLTREFAGFRFSAWFQWDLRLIRCG